MIQKPERDGRAQSSRTFDKCYGEMTLMKSCVVRPDLVLDFDCQKSRGRHIETFRLWEMSGLPSSSRNRLGACRGGVDASQTFWYSFVLQTTFGGEAERSARKVCILKCIPKGVLSRRTTNLKSKSISAWNPSALNGCFTSFCIDPNTREFLDMFTGMFTGHRYACANTKTLRQRAVRFRALKQLQLDPSSRLLPQAPARWHSIGSPRTQRTPEIFRKPLGNRNAKGVSQWFQSSSFLSRFLLSALLIHSCILRFVEQGKGSFECLAHIEAFDDNPVFSHLVPHILFDRISMVCII